MITFNVGPSQISSEVNEDIRNMLDKGILSISHRSEQFTNISKSLHTGLRKFLDIPEDYKIFYLSSATEAMEVVLRNFVLKDSFHFVNGAFSEKFYKTSFEIGKTPQKEEIEWGEGNFKYLVPEKTELICLTQNETSTGVYIPNEYIKDLRSKYQDKLIAVDVVSSIGGVFPNIKNADIWFFSIQKCFGLPSGLGIMIVNEKAIEKSKEIYTKTGDIGSTHSVLNMLKKYDKFQTNETPNIFAIYLLSKQLERFNLIGKKEIERQTKEKFEFLDDFFNNSNKFTPFVKDEKFRSKTVYVFKADKELQKNIKEKLQKKDIVIGNGYGKLKNEVLRIANFPTIKIDDLKLLTLNI